MAAAVAAATAFPWVVKAGEGRGSSEAADEPGMEMAAYLGVATAPVDETLGLQLALPRGVGLVVQFVDPDSPASGKLREHDVLHKLNEQILVNHQQLAVLVRSMRPGEEVALSLVRAGRKEEAKVKLGEKRMPKLNAGGAWEAPAPLFQRGPMIRMQRPWQGFGKATNEWPGFDFEQWFGGWDEQVPGAGPGAKQGPAPGARHRAGAWAGGGGQSKVVLVEDGATVTLTRNAKGERHLSATDKDGKSLFDGPINTDEERAKVPEAIRESLKHIEDVRIDTDAGDRKSGGGMSL
jgi:hypothetical protein